uniref:Fatty acid binding protein 5 n=1 Tax=Felis catus TaxID=9685 RepID=A0ABI7W796_FELCA
MATLQQLVGRWRLVESKGFDEYMKEVGVGMALRKVGAMAKPDCIISSDGKNLTIKTESTLKTTQFSCNLGEKFEETTADGRKTQTVCTFTNGALVQHQEWDGKESTITRKLEDGKLVVFSVVRGKLRRVRKLKSQSFHYEVLIFCQLQRETEHEQGRGRERGRRRIGNRLPAPSHQPRA